MKCSSFFDFHCHIQYICMSWVLMFCLFLAIFPTVIVLLWLLHQNGLFDPFYDWWEDHFWDEERKIRHISKHGLDADCLDVHCNKHHKKKPRHHTGGPHKRRRSIYQEHRHNHSERDGDYHYHLHQVKRDKHKHGRVKGSSIILPLYVDKGEDDIVGKRRWRKEREIMEEVNKFSGHGDGIPKATNKHKHVTLDDTHHKHLHAKRRA